ncbi:MAG: LysR family transcriptional regulator [Actinomycetales bacterium]|nr:LysR family transcriptional regulator [Actinomycetales bacterium]
MQQLASFVAVADTGTIVAAATRLGLSASAVRASLDEFEKVLGVQLCVRQRAKGVTLTSAGEAVLAKAREVLQDAADLELDVRGEPGQVGGVVHVGCYATLGPTVLPPLLASFGRRFPAARVDVREESLDRLRRAVSAREVDVVIAYDIDLPRHWTWVPWLTSAPRIHLAQGHPLATSEGGVRLADLADEPMILLDVPPSGDHVLQMCRSAGFDPRVGLRTSNYETARALVGRGLGWSLLVQRTPVDISYEGRAVRTFEVIDPPLPPVSIVVAWRREAPLSRAAQAFVTLAAQGPSAQ